ncbi:MAG TPA: type II and III secretion system protein family protein [Pyrinomonadaceae bacterium]|jgi:pilus assembly protein CpaC
MQTRRLIPLFVALLACAGIMFAAPVGAHAQEVSVRASFAAPPKEPIAINVLVGQSRVINFDKAIGRFSVSNPDVAEAVLVAPDQVLVNGKAFGQVNFIAWEKEKGQFVVFDVFVRANLSLIDSQIHALFPKDDIRLSQANGSVVLSGNVSNPLVAAQAEQVVKAAGFQTVNMLGTPVKGIAQVQLQVRVAEVSRNRLREYGTSFMTGKDGTATYTNSGNGPSNLSDFNSPTHLIESAVSPALNVFFLNNPAGIAAMLRAVRQTGAIRSLAEPNLIAMDGQQASFLAGGEFPIPVVQSGADRNTVTVVFKEYGIRLNFKPTILDEDHIRLELEPEVSTIDFSNGVKFDGFVIPALKTRRAKTGVELRDGQSFALAGLLDNNEIQTFSKIPVISEVPILGNLFKSKSFQKNETELMFIITAQLVRPVSPDDIPTMRGIDGLKKASPLGVEPKGEGIKGASGYSSGATGAGDADKQEEKQTDAPKTDTQKTDATSGAAEQMSGGPKTNAPAPLPQAATQLSLAQIPPVTLPVRKH